jgi:steroid delta-isomerase
MEDPVGTPLKHGRDEVGAFYDQGHELAESIELRPLGIAVVVGGEAAFAFQVRTQVGGSLYTMPVIDVMTFDDDARITSQRAFQSFDDLTPATE